MGDVASCRSFPPPYTMPVASPRVPVRKFIYSIFFKKNIKWNQFNIPVFVFLFSVPRLRLLEHATKQQPRTAVVAAEDSALDLPSPSAHQPYRQRSYGNLLTNASSIASRLLHLTYVMPCIVLIVFFTFC